MCGIFASPSPELTQHMLEQMRYRGPDAQEIISAGGFSIGLARLAILSAENPLAKQPQWTRKRRVVAFNGEIYNYQDLQGCPVFPLTEVKLLGEMLDVGMDPRQFVDGDYAIIYYDPSNQTVTLYRDRFGFCPLYYQLRPFVAVSSERRRLTHAREVPAHSKVVLNLRTKRLVSCSTFQHYGITANSPQRLKQELSDAVRSRALHADKGFSVALSGGVDSSLIALLCTEEVMAPPRAAICVAPYEQSVDLEHARKVVKRVGCPLHEVIISREVVAEAIPKVYEHLDCPGHRPEPMKWRAALRNWFVARESPTRVILCGEGADEVVEGYLPHTQRYLGSQYLRLQHQHTAIKSLPAINLDRTNKLGLAHSKEFRAPFLASRLSYCLLSTKRWFGKKMLRAELTALGAGDLVTPGKWSEDEEFLDRMIEEETRKFYAQGGPQ